MLTAIICSIIGFAIADFVMSYITGMSEKNQTDKTYVNIQARLDRDNGK